MTKNDKHRSNKEKKKPKKDKLKTETVAAKPFAKATTESSKG
jgi:hypothetical protein